MIQFEPLHVLFQSGNFEIYTWGFFFVAAFLATFFLVLKQAKKQKIDGKHILNIALLILIGAVIGPRLVYVFEHLTYFLGSPTEIFSMSEGGITSYGAFLGVLFVWLYTRKKKDISFSQILDFVAPYILLAIAITRIGCFLNWCCYGQASQLPWAISAAGDTARHPTQLYEIVYSLVGFFILLKFKKIRDKGKIVRKSAKFKKLLQKKGSLFLFFLLFYSFFRFFNDFLREYKINFLGLALSQWICLAAFVLAVVLLSLKKQCR